MKQNGFDQFAFVNMWEIVLITFIKSSKRFLLGNPQTKTKACGMGNLIGNKGAVQIYFSFNDKNFNIFGVHLIHGQDNQEKRDAMMEELIQSMKFGRQELDADIISDYNFIMGDLNYRFNCSFEEMISTGQINIAPELLNEMDQLTITRTQKNRQIYVLQPDGTSKIVKPTLKYPDYHEAKIEFLPTYKRNIDDNNYKNKKS